MKITFSSSQQHLKILRPPSDVILKPLEEAVFSFGRTKKRAQQVLIWLKDGYPQARQNNPLALKEWKIRSKVAQHASLNPKRKWCSVGMFPELLLIRIHTQTCFVILLFLMQLEIKADRQDTLSILQVKGAMHLNH